MAGEGPRVESELTGVAARIAGGSGIVLLGGFADRGFRWFIGYLLSWWLGPAGLGLYQTAAKVSATITAFSPLGLDTGVVLFAARYRNSGETDKLKGTLLAGLGIALLMGVLSSLGLLAAARWGPWWQGDSEVGALLFWVAPAIAAWTPLLFLVGALRAAKDMRRSSLAYQVVLPGTLLLGHLALVGALGLGVRGAVIAYVVAHCAALTLAARFAWVHYGPVLTDRTIRAVTETGRLLAFSIPQSLTAAAFQLNMQMDVLMLAILSGSHEVGLYYVAASLASFGSIPSNAVASMFNPFIAELVHAGDFARLSSLLRTVTRWLVVVAAPVYIVLLLLPGVVLSIYDDAFAVSAGSLVVLVAGQIVNTACAPAMRVIPMAGHSLLNLANGVAALLLNVGLNTLLIPRYGALGASIATAVTLTLWSAWRLAEVWWMFRIFPFDRNTWLLLGIAGVGGLLVRELTVSQAIGWRLLGTVVLLLGFGLAVRLLCNTPEDLAVVSRIKARFLRFRAR